MRIVVLASGSKGNSTYIEIGNSKILIDLGVSTSYIKESLKQIQILPEEITHVLITHTHGDHTKGLKSFIKKYRPILALTEKMKTILKIEEYDNTIYYQPKLLIDNINLTIFRTSHDVEESFAFVLKHNNKSVVYITDTGYLNLRYFSHLKNKDVYIIESNHDIELLLEGPYPHHLKQRILSDQGHLSNHDCGKYLAKLVGDKTKHIVLAHLSAENNDPDLALATVQKMITEFDIDIQVATQSEITSIIEV